MKHVCVSLCVCLAVGILIFSGCRSPYYADKGAFVGGLTGAGVGAAVGKRNGNTMAGTLIGGAVGTLAGNAIGESIDADIARNNAIIQQQLGRRLAGAVMISDVVSMSQAGLSDEVIITHIRAYGVAQRPSVNDMISMKQQGVSDRVINEMQNPPPPTVPSRPVIVEEHHYHGRPNYWHPHRHYHHGYGRPHHKAYWGITIGARR